MDEIRRLEALKDKEINEAKKILAFEATKICRGEKEAKLALETATKTFEQGSVDDNLPSVNIAEKEVSVLDAFVAIGFVTSKGEARRLIKQAGLKLNDKVITDENYVISLKDAIDGNIKLSQGKKKHGLIVLAKTA
jgi:tyrosyl-tRNA synthetase